MSSIVDECPICMDNIEVSKNCIVTECGHKFHASCLLSSVAHSNFACPCCRYELAEHPEESDYDSDDGSEEEAVRDLQDTDPDADQGKIDHEKQAIPDVHTGNDPPEDTRIVLDQQRPRRDIMEHQGGEDNGHHPCGGDPER